FDRAPLEDRLLRANPAQPPKGKDARTPASPAGDGNAMTSRTQQRQNRKKRSDRKDQPRSAFATELPKVLEGAEPSHVCRARRRGHFIGSRSTSQPVFLPSAHL